MDNWKAHRLNRCSQRHRLLLTFSAPKRKYDKSSDNSRLEECAHNVSRHLDVRKQLICTDEATRSWVSQVVDHSIP
uniref:Uncharacterized protein n=1 Tax=Arundo donax TaxID=35708 RepID=A0A0A9H1J4_ARUDO